MHMTHVLCVQKASWLVDSSPNSPWMSEFLTQSKPSHPVEKSNFSSLYLQSHPFGNYFNLMAIKVRVGM